MAITKTDFINYTRCSRYAALECINKDKLDADISYSEYKRQEEEELLNELFSSMFEKDDDGELIDLTEKENAQLKAMMPYYKMVESEAGRISVEVFGGKSTYADNTLDQVCYDYLDNGIRYICYVDIYNETDDNVNIIEVKATTSKKYYDLKCGYRGKDKYSIFTKVGNILKLKGEIKGYDLESEMSLEDYEKCKQKLFDRYNIGKYIYDLSIQRNIIENYAKKENANIDNYNYYLGVLNNNYIFDGEYINNKPNYKEINNEQLILFIDLNEITKEYQKYIDVQKKLLENNIFNPKIKRCDLGVHCERKKSSECKYLSAVCGKDIPSKNSSLNYLNNGQGFKNEFGERIKGLDLINHGYLHMLDVPEEYITSIKHLKQRECLEFNRVYINKEKLKSGLKLLKYPIYHLDFETFPCPVPRFKGEWPYIQSPFEFSIHIEREEGVCDNDKDNYVFLCSTFKDEREDLVKKLVEIIKPGGTMFAQNVGFEKGRIKELAQIYPEYKDRLMEIHDKGFDLLWLINTNSAIYKELGYSEEESKLFNYYNSELSGSFSIKKTLPVFSDLSYKNLVVKNGTEAIVVYANYEKMSKEEFNLKYDALVTYCKQDTYAMVVILNELRKLVK